MDNNHIRNFSIIAHIDHGKSTLADRLIEQTQTVQRRDMMDQILDQMDLERERGITIKAQAVRLAYHHTDSKEYELNLIDTPGHVDFTYEVSRSLAACEGALLLVDAAQGIQAQTLANIYLAIENDLTIIPVINKIDLPSAQPEVIALEMERMFGFKQDEIIFCSAKDGTGVDDILAAIVSRIPPPEGAVDGSLRALVFDSKYDSYKGVIAYVRIIDGSLKQGDPLLMMGTGARTDSLEIGFFKPHLTESPSLSSGQVGYIATGLKDVRQCTVGETITLSTSPAINPLPGYAPSKAMVFAGFYPMDGQDYGNLRDALDKLQLNDAALSYTAESSQALGFGFQCGFLGLLHMDIIQERLEREFGLELVATAPSVSYEVLTHNDEIIQIENPSKLPASQSIQEIREPWLNLTIITPSQYIGSVMELLSDRRGVFKKMEYIETQYTEGVSADNTDGRVMLEYELSLREMLVEFYDKLKSYTQGYATLDYSIKGYQASPLVKLDILVNDEIVDALSTIVHKDIAYSQGRLIVQKLKELLPRQMFLIPIQAAIGSKIISRESIRPLRKNVLAKCYGGDISRKKKLLQKQAAGKKRLRKVGRVEIPQEAFLSVLKTS
jgi:GTP-binding protein LepA